ncbi:MAG TPA: hypothetical protein PK919_06425 [Candidatus Aminicenantes bacterium]|nr:hypothetical protein [Candidatus Aminicenantes bacterium]
MIKTVRVALPAFLLCCCFLLVGELVPDPETESSVPELIAFHEIIVPMWHAAFPAKDCTALRGFLPGIEAGAAKINAAVLPGILREKKGAWDKGLADFNLAVGAYKKAAVGTDDPALLAAAEMLQMSYEMLIRAIRPAAGEVDAYHKVLYVVYHKYLPENKHAEICGLAADMVADAEAITRVTLSKRLEAKTEAFQAAAAALLDETRALQAAAAACAAQDVAGRVARVHDAYMALERALE